MSIELDGWRLESICSDKTPNYQSWSFRYKNYSQFKVVVQYTNGQVKGEQEFINLLKGRGILKSKYKPDPILVKAYYESSQRCQTGSLMNGYGKQNLKDDM